MVKGDSHRIIHRHRDIQVCVHLPTEARTLLRVSIHKPARHALTLACLHSRVDTVTCWAISRNWAMHTCVATQGWVCPQVGDLLTHRPPHRHTQLCLREVTPTPTTAPLPLPRPHQALPQRLLLHGWHDLCLNVHIQVKFQGEALLAWVLKGHRSVSFCTSCL